MFGHFSTLWMKGLDYSDISHEKVKTLPGNTQNSFDFVIVFQIPVI